MGRKIELIVFALFCVQSQSRQDLAPATLKGSWVYVSSSASTGQNPTVEGRRIRMYTDQEWYIAQVDPSKGISFLYGGHYALSGSSLTETVDYASAGMAVVVNQQMTFRVKSESETLTFSGRHPVTGPTAGDSDEIWRRQPASADGRPPGTLTAAEFADVELLQRALSAPTQNLAASYLGNHNRLDILALYEKGENKNTNFFFGSDQVTPSNVKQLTAQFQHREDVYSAELRRRGTPELAGRYRMQTVQPCPDSGNDSMAVELKQDGFAIDVRTIEAPAGHLISGAAAGGVLTIGDGDFDADQYFFGTIGAGRRIELRAFSGRGCAIALVR